MNCAICSKPIETGVPSASIADPSKAKERLPAHLHCAAEYEPEEAPYEIDCHAVATELRDRT